MTISRRYLSEGERIIIADALEVGKCLPQIAGGWWEIRRAWGR